jgi:hypothetical protein
MRFFFERVEAAPPHYEHVVVVMEENRSDSSIVGDRVNAPYLISLIDGGVLVGSMFAIQHPSQPNYLHLFSGANQGVNDDNRPVYFSTTETPKYPFKTPNLGEELVKAGFSFAGFAEALETAGTNDWADYDPHSTNIPDPHYRRRHLPWVNWIAKTNPIPTNQLSPAVNLAFREFPSDYNMLPTVAFVIPSLLNDMHDGSRKDGDAWLMEHLGAYAAWARTNNSLLIITWDEDDKVSGNQIPLILYGAGLHEGTVLQGSWTHHNLLRTIESIYGLQEHAGSSAMVRPIVGAFQSDPAVTTVSFQNGTNGYMGSKTAQIAASGSDSSFLQATNLFVAYDADTSIAGNQPAQVLIKFADIFGSGTNRVPFNCLIESAKLLLYTDAASGSSGSFLVNQMLKMWDESTTWQSMDTGVAMDDVEARAAATFTLAPSVDNALAIFDVSDDVAAFQLGATNNGWVILALPDAGSDIWSFKSGQDASQPLRPRLEITYSQPALAAYRTWATRRGLSPPLDAINADPDGDGTLNLLEFAFNMDPLAPDSHTLETNEFSGLPTGTVDVIAANPVLKLVFVRRKGAAADGLSYGAEFSSDLINWVEGGTEEIMSDNGDFETIGVSDPHPSRAQARFARVAIKFLN